MFKKSKKFVTISIAAAMALTGMLAVTGTASAAGYLVNQYAMTGNFHPEDRLNVRAWPAAHSRKLSHIRLGKQVFVERCIIKNGSDWCKI